MMRCCKHCGALLEDDAKVCDFCGAVLEVPKFEPAPEKVAVAEAPVQEVTEAPTKKPFSKKKLFIIIGIAIGVIAVAVAVLLLFFNPHVAVSKYEAVLNGEFDKVESLAPQECWNTAAKQSKMDTDKYIDTLTETLEKNHLKKLAQESILGKFVSIKLQVLNTEELNDTDMTGVKEALEETYGIDQSRIKSAYKLFLKVVSKGTKESSSVASMVTAIKIDSEWYLIRYTRTGEDSYRANFIASGQDYELYYFY
ncbi:MAG: zinc ribbon domain-containing protein [Ruminococcaceae bacterium]|nr:zinc ribbon domain-containing protein [Oscillospiraceae bacterium]